MSAANPTLPFPVQLSNSVRLDPILLGATLSLLLGGLVVLGATGTVRRDLARASGMTTLAP